MDATLQTAVDRHEIENLLVRYAVALDTHDWELLATCFTDDVSYAFAHAGDVEGFAAVEAICRRSLGPLDASQHLVGAALVEVDGDSARSRCSFQAQHVLGGEQYIVAGTYVDELRRTAAGWRISRRELQRVWTDGNPSVLARD